MICPKCTGLLIHEDLHERSGRFLGWRCVQCGLRLDETIAQNRLEARPVVSPEDADEPESDDYLADLPSKPSGRHKRSARAV